MLSKEECGHALSIFCENNVFKDISDDVLEENYHVLEQLINEHFELVEGGWHDKEYQEFKNPQAYKFEDLKDGMWVWDSVECECIRLLKTYITDDEHEFYTQGVKVIRTGYKYSWEEIGFRENRFYPVQMANVKG